MTVNCPRHGVALQSKELHGISVEICPSCGGMFLDRGELSRVADETPGDIEFSTLDKDQLEHDDGSARLSCPRDGAAMSKVEFNIDTNIVLDYCSSGCHGFWLDAEELVRINQEIRELNEAAREVPDPPLTRLGQFFWNLPLPR
jgi:Zn-finger nucleic acid-binding protein